MGNPEQRYNPVDCGLAFYAGCTAAYVGSKEGYGAADTYLVQHVAAVALMVLDRLRGLGAPVGVLRGGLPAIND